MKRIVRRVLATLACTSALLASAPTLASVQWTFQVLDSAIPPPGITFNGTRTVNAGGTSMWDVPLGTLGLWGETVTPVAINDSGWVISYTMGWWSEQAWLANDPIYPIPTLTVNGVLNALPTGGSGTPAAINNHGFVLVNGKGPLPQTWPYEIPGSFSNGVIKVSPVVYINLNDAGQILAHGYVSDVGSTVGGTGFMILTPVPEPHSALLALAALVLLAGRHYARKGADRRSLAT